MMRTDINLAIVAMVEEPVVDTSNATDQYCYIDETKDDVATVSIKEKYFIYYFSVIIKYYFNCPSLACYTLSHFHCLLLLKNTSQIGTPPKLLRKI